MSVIEVSHDTRLGTIGQYCELRLDAPVSFGRYSLYGQANGVNEMANNQGIFHLNLNGRVACKRMNAHMYIKIDEFRTTASRRCARCVALLAKMDDVAARKAAREAARS